MEYKSKEEVTKIIANCMFDLKKQEILGYFRKTLTNMKNFWLTIGRDELL